MSSIHSRLDELAVAGWIRGMPSAPGVIAVDKEVHTVIDGRVVSFACYMYRREGLRWSCSAQWGSDLSKRQRRYLKRHGHELVALSLDGTLRSTLESHRDPSKSTAEERIHVGTGAIGFGALGDPPPTDSIIAACQSLTRIATTIEQMIETP